MKEFWVEVKILPKKEILDVQGRALVQTLEQNGRKVQNCRFGKCIQILIEASDENQACQKIKEMADFILYNPLTETYTVEVISS